MNEKGSSPLASATATVLVVDDEPGLVDLYTMWLEETYPTRVAYDSSEHHPATNDDGSQ